MADRKEILERLRSIIDYRLMLMKRYSGSCNIKLKDAWKEVDTALWNLEEAIFDELEGLL